MSNYVIELINVVKTYNIGTDNELEILHGINLKVEEGEFVAIVGESGSGKTTLMNILGLLDSPTYGDYRINGCDIKELNEKEKSRIRNKQIGFVFQNFKLIPRMSALKNVELPMMYASILKKERRKKAKELIEQVGMSQRSNHYPNELSGGQKQRIAIARAISNDPAIILADEPTGALDTKTSQNILDLFKALNANNKTIILITHSNEIAKATNRIITLRDGNIVSDKAN